MIDVRPFAQLGHANHGWLDANYHFSFSRYYDPNRMNWGALRVWNDDIIAPGTGFGTHPHDNMEIITYVRQGAIAHEDSLGNKGRTLAGDVQVMSAGTGIRHSEHNLEDVPTHVFQIWIIPNKAGHVPSWGTRSFPKDGRAGRFVTLASGYPNESEALPIHADARVLGATLSKGESLEYLLGTQRLAYLVLAKGAIEINGKTVNERDGVAISETEELKIHALEESEIVMVDTAP